MCKPLHLLWGTKNGGICIAVDILVFLKGWDFEDGLKLTLVTMPGGGHWSGKPRRSRGLPRIRIRSITSGLKARLGTSRRLPLTPGWRVWQEPGVNSVWHWSLEYDGNSLQIAGSAPARLAWTQPPFCMMVKIKVMLYCLEVQLHPSGTQGSHLWNKGVVSE